MITRMGTVSFAEGESSYGQADLASAFATAKARRFAWVTGDNDGNDQDLVRLADEAGYKVYFEGTEWVAIRRDLYERGQEHHLVVNAPVSEITVEVDPPLT